MELFAILFLAAVASATDHGPTARHLPLTQWFNDANRNALQYGGSGPYKSYAFEVESLANHTFYQPLESAGHSSLKLPVIVWGNGGFRKQSKTNHSLNFTDSTTVPVGSAFRSFLGEVASYGALAIATGPIYVDPETYQVDDSPLDPNNLGEDPDALTATIDWVHAQAGKGDWKHIDPARIGVWGQSCGGLEAYGAGVDDPRVGHLGIFNSGQLNASASTAVAGKIKKPVFYLLGGPTDVAYPNGERDYASLPRGTPAWKGNHGLGHSVAFDVPNAGIPGIVGRHMLQWLLRGDVKERRWFVGDGPGAIGVGDVDYKSLKGIKVTPI